MKDFLNKEHYCYKMHTLLMKSSAFLPSFIGNPLYGLLLHFYKKILIPPFYDFLKISSPLKTRGGSHYVNVIGILMM